MFSFKKATALVVITHLCMPAIAQDDAELAREAREEETRLRAVEVQQETDIIRRRSNQVEVEIRMKDAEQRLAEAARRVADLSMAQLPRVERLERIIQANRGPMLGVTIGGENEDGPVEGVNILGVRRCITAENAGQKAGDVIAAINDE